MKPLPWFRAYTEMIDDEKLGLLSFEDRWHFVALLCLKGKGILDTEPDPSLLQRKVALKMGLSCTELENVVRRLAQMGLINQDTFQPTSWDGRQLQSDVDPTNALRQQRYRESQAAKKQEAALRNAPVTRLDTDKDTDKEEDKYPVGFESAWALYPDRPGKSKANSLKAWNARLKSGTPPEDMLQGVTAYAAYCRAMRTEPGYIKQPETFFGPGLHFQSDWTAPRGKHQVPGMQPGDSREIPDAE